MCWTTCIDGIVAIDGFVSRTRHLKHCRLGRSTLCLNERKQQIVNKGIKSQTQRQRTHVSVCKYALVQQW